MKKALELLGNLIHFLLPLIILIEFLYSPVLIPVSALDDLEVSDKNGVLRREEVISLRTENSKTFKITSSIEEYFEVEVDSSKMHYLEEGGYEEVDNEIVYEKQDTYEYTNKANDFTFRAGEKLSEGVYFEEGGEICKFSLDSVSDGNINESEAVIEENKIKYSEIYENADLEFTIQNDGLKTEIVAKDEKALKKEIKFDVSNCKIETFDEAVMSDENSEGVVKESVEKSGGREKLVLEPDYDTLGEIDGEVRIDPSITSSTSYDTFVSPSTRWSGNGRRRAMFIGTYTDYTVSGWPVFRTSRALINFGNLNIPNGAIVESATLQVWHYGTNSNNQALYVSGITSDWNESTVWPGPSHSGNFGSQQFPYYNSNYTAQIREINLNTSVVDYLRSRNRGLMIRNYDENARGCVICSRNIPSGPCKAGMEPKVVIRYKINKAPNSPNLDYPNDGWELGANESYSSVNCDKSGKGKGCDITFRAQTEDPDNSFPLETTVEVRRSEGGDRNFSNSQNGEGWFERQRHLNDGHWTWRARTKDSYNDWSNWSVNKQFIVDTTAPSKPKMKSEPEYSPGDQNTVYSTVSKDGIIGGVRYNFQVSENSNFSSIKESSGWVEKREFTFGSLEDEKIYYYRVRARDRLGNTTGWGKGTNSIQDATNPEINNIYMDYGKISPANQDGKFDYSNLSFEVYDEHISEVSVQLISSENEVVHEYTGLAEKVNLEIDGRDSNDNFLSDGVYTVNIVAEDLAGNRTENKDNLLFIDNNPPFINVSSPEDGSWVNYLDIDISGITDVDAILDILHLENSELIRAVIDPDTGIFSEELHLIDGENTVSLVGEDPYGNINEKEMKIYTESEVPYISDISPKSVINDRKPEIIIDAEDFGYEDYVSGINVNKTYLSITDQNGKEIVLVNEGVNISSLGHIEHNCNGTGKYGLSGPKSCTIKYIFDNELQPDGKYRITVKIYDKAGNYITHNMQKFTLDSHIYHEVLEPVDGTLFNHSQINLKGTAERYSELEIVGIEDNVNITIDPSSTSATVIVDNCRASTDPNSDGIEEICDWEIHNFQLSRDLANDIEVYNQVSIKLRDLAGNESSIDHEYKVNLFAVNLSIDTDIIYFSPNGDGRQDGIEFLDMETNGVVDNWKINLKDEARNIVKVIEGQSSIPGNVYWNGKDESGNYVSDGDYSYSLYLKTTDGIEFETNPVEIYARVDLSDKVYITYPRDNAVTTRGVTNIQGQAPIDSKVRICVDTIGLSGSCDFEYEAEVDENGSFSRVVPLVRLQDQTQTEHIISAVAFDEYGNQTDPSNKVRVIVDVTDPFVSISALPALTGVNNEEDYQVILDKLDNGEEITQEDLNNLKTVILRSTVTGNTERVKLSYAEIVSLDELPEDMDYSYLGYIDADNETKLYEQYEDGVTAVESCNEAECTWDFYYPVPPVDGGVYEIEFDGKKGETIQKFTASVMIDGTIPLAPVILDINKIIDSEVLDANLFQDRYYSNSELVEIKGAADPNTDIQIEDQNGNKVCNTTTDSIGLFYCNIDASDFYSDLNTKSRDLVLTTTATDGLNIQESFSDVHLIIDKIKPVIKDIQTTNRWHRSGDYADLSITANEILDLAYITNPQDVKYSFSLTRDYKGGISYNVIHGLALEGKYEVGISIFDMAGNQSYGSFFYYIDNTKPNEVNIDTSKWGTKNGINALEDTPAQGRLVPEYVVRGEYLTISGQAEKNSFIEIYVDGGIVADMLVKSSNCLRKEKDKVTSDKVIVRNGKYCNWEYQYHMSEERGYVFSVKVKDRAGNKSLISEDEIVYLDKTEPEQPRVSNVSSESYEPILYWKQNGENLSLTKDTSINLKGYGEALSDYEYWIERPNGAGTDYTYFVNSGYEAHKMNFNLGSEADRGNCIRNINGKRTGVCQDGIYDVRIKSTDAAGNGSDYLDFSIERDTVAPAKPVVNEPYDCGESICAVVNGEIDSYVYVNGRRIEELKSQNQLIKIRNDFSYNKLYKFNIQLIDRAGNKSEISYVEYHTPEAPQGEVEGATEEDEFDGEKGSDLENVKFDVSINLHTNSYQISNINIPAPELIKSNTNYDGSVEVFGVGIPKNHELEANINVTYMTYNEASKECNVGLWIDKEEKKCMEEKMGIDNLSSWIWKVQKKCGIVIPIYSGMCISNAKNTKREIVNKGIINSNVQHVMVTIEKSLDSTNYGYLATIWNDDFLGRFKYRGKLGSDLDAGNTVKSHVSIFGEFEYKGININYSGDTDMTSEENKGIRSKDSNLLVIEGAPEFRDVVVSPVGHSSCSGAIYTSAYGWRQNPWDSKLDTWHSGVDIAKWAKDKGCVITAVYDGEGYTTWYAGKTVVIKHDGEFETRYGHAHSYIGDFPRNNVQKGEEIMYMGKSGNATGVHIHFEVWRNGATVNPNDYFRKYFIELPSYREVNLTNVHEGNEKEI